MLSLATILDNFFMDDIALDILLRDIFIYGTTVAIADKGLVDTARTDEGVFTYLLEVTLMLATSVVSIFTSEYRRLASPLR